MQHDTTAVLMRMQHDATAVLMGMRHNITAVLMGCNMTGCNAVLIDATAVLMGVQHEAAAVWLGVAPLPSSIISHPRNVKREVSNKIHPEQESL
jgi:hypothetical protein